VPDLTLTAEELRDAGMAMRAVACRAIQDAEAMAASSKDYGFTDTARRYTALGEKFEAARKTARGVLGIE
jgi:hypothetical protein